MKTILSTFFLTFVLSLSWAQDPIVVSGTCGDADALGTYVYNGEVNSRPSYRKGDSVAACIDLLNDDACSNYDPGTVYFVEWNGTRWEWKKQDVPQAPCVWLVQLCVPKSVGEEPTETILASSTEDDSTPACTGWVAESGACVPTFSTCTITSVTETPESSDITIFPNPIVSGETLTVTLPTKGTEEVLSIKIFNQEGKLVQEQERNNDEEQITIATSLLESGVYSLQIQSSVTHYSSKLLIK